MKAKFAGGPLDGREIVIPGEKPVLEVRAGTDAPLIDDAHASTRITFAGSVHFPTAHIGDVQPITRYVLHYERRGVAHYYISTGER